VVVAEPVFVPVPGVKFAVVVAAPVVKVLVLQSVVVTGSVRVFELQTNYTPHLFFYALRHAGTSLAQSLKRQHFP